MPVTGGQGTNEQGLSLGDSLAIAGADVSAVSSLGTPVWSDMLLDATESSVGFYFDAVLITVSRKETIVVTPVAGRRSSVKELYGAEDWNVSIRAVITSADKQKYPHDQVRELNEILNQGRALKVVSPYLQLFDIYELAVTDKRFPQNEGFINVQAVEIEALSDEPIELIEDATLIR